MRKVLAFQFIFVLLLGSSFNGCGPHRKRPGVPVQELPPLTRTDSVQNMTVHAHGVWTDEEWVVIKANLETNLNIYSSDVGHTLAPAVVDIIQAETFKCGEVIVLGCTQADDLGFVRLVQTVVGDQLELPATYHELCHWDRRSVIYGLDPGHEDPLWPTWEQRRQEVINLILSQNP